MTHARRAVFVVALGVTMLLWQADSNGRAGVVEQSRTNTALPAIETEPSTEPDLRPAENVPPVDGVELTVDEYEADVRNDVDFRKSLYLQSDEGFVRSLYTSNRELTTGTRLLGALFTPEEAAEVTLRSEGLSADAEQVLAQVSESKLNDRFGGVWIDHERGGLLVAAFTDDLEPADRESLRTSVKHDDRLLIETVDHTEAELQAAVDRLSWEELGSAFGSKVTAAGVDIMQNGIYVMFADPVDFDPGHAAKIAGVPVRSETGSTDKANDRSHDDPPYRAGHAILVGWPSTATLGKCTLAFRVTRTSDGQPRMLTAGHCYEDAPGYPYTKVYHDDSSPNLVGEYGNYSTGGPLDFWAFQTNSVSTEARVFTSWPNTLDVKGKETTYVVGTPDCTSGRYAHYSCGTIVDNYFDPNGETYGMIRASYTIVEGDSGGPAWHTKSGGAYATGVISCAVYNQQGVAYDGCYGKISSILNNGYTLSTK